jgi:hypothetical protein
MNESPVAREWRAEARREGEMEAKAEWLLRILRRLGSVSDDLAARISASTADDALDRWLDSALNAKSVEEFRTGTGL